MARYWTLTQDPAKKRNDLEKRRHAFVFCFSRSTGPRDSEPDVCLATGNKGSQSNYKWSLHNFFCMRTDELSIQGDQKIL